MSQNKNPFIRGNSNPSYMPQQNNIGQQNSMPNMQSLMSEAQPYLSGSKNAQQEVMQLIQNNPQLQSQFDNYSNKASQIMKMFGIK